MLKFVSYGFVGDLLGVDNTVGTDCMIQVEAFVTASFFQSLF